MSNQPYTPNAMPARQWAKYDRQNWRRLEDSRPTSCNNGFWDRDPQERAAKMDAACERGGVSNFFDLSPEERGQCYDAE
jgi:hypothetical protein